MNANTKTIARRISAVLAGLLAAAGLGIVADWLTVTLVNAAVTLTGSFFFSYLVYLLCLIAGFAAVLAGAVLTYRYVSNTGFDVAVNSTTAAATWLRSKFPVRAAA